MVKHGCGNNCLNNRETWIKKTLKEKKYDFKYHTRYETVTFQCHAPYVVLYDTSIGRFAVDREFVNIENSPVKHLRTLFPKPCMSGSPMRKVCEGCSEPRLLWKRKQKKQPYWLPLGTSWVPLGLSWHVIGRFPTPRSAQDNSQPQMGNSQSFGQAF